MDPIDPSTIPLRDIHLPDAISWWPLATGWWLILALVIAMAVFSWLYLRRQKNNHQQMILQSLQAIESQFRADGDNHRLAKQLSILARQITLLQLDEDSHEQRALVGDAWAQFWQQRIANGSLGKDELHQALNVAPYRENEELDGEKLLAAFRQSVLQPSTSNRKHSA